MRLPVSLKRTQFAAAVFVGALLLLGAGDNSARVERLGHEMMCMCGCNQILLECNHAGCTYSDTMRRELVNAVDRNDEDKAVVQTFIDKYGTTVLAAPGKKGFDLIAWVLPYVALVLGLLGVSFVVKAWRGRMTAAPVAAPKDSAELASFREQARKETEL